MKKSSQKEKRCPNTPFNLPASEDMGDHRFSKYNNHGPWYTIDSHEASCRVGVSTRRVGFLCIGQWQLVLCIFRRVVQTWTFKTFKSYQLLYKVKTLDLDFQLPSLGYYVRFFLFFFFLIKCSFMRKRFMQYEPVTEPKI